MARLSDQEKAQLKAGARRKTPRPPPVSARPVDQFLAFVSLASTFKPAPKPVRFVGQHWKL
jgi:hypothetical protein